MVRVTKLVHGTGSEKHVRAQGSLAMLLAENHDFERAAMMIHKSLALLRTIHDKALAYIKAGKHHKGLALMTLTAQIVEGEQLASLETAVMMYNFARTLYDACKSPVACSSHGPRLLCPGSVHRTLCCFLSKGV
jgi:hypothetical protein